MLFVCMKLVRTRKGIDVKDGSFVMLQFWKKRDISYSLSDNEVTCTLFLRRKNYSTDCSKRIKYG